MAKFEPIVQALNEDGWEVARLDLSSDCWWAKEIWRLKSDWSPVGATLFLTLLIDPQFDGDKNNLPDEAVWMIGLSDSIPRERGEAERLTFLFKGRFSDAPKEILREAAQMRRPARLLGQGDLDGA